MKLDTDGNEFLFCSHGNRDSRRCIDLQRGGRHGVRLWQPRGFEVDTPMLFSQRAGHGNIGLHAGQGLSDGHALRAASLSALREPQGEADVEVSVQAY